jgi:hypothetical protein
MSGEAKEMVGGGVTYLILFVLYSGGHVWTQMKYVMFLIREIEQAY